MKTQSKGAAELRRENAELRARLDEAEETLRAIRAGEVDALVVGGQIYSLKTAETPYRVILETMNEGAATLLADGTVLYANERLAALLGRPLEGVLGYPLRQFVTAADWPIFDTLLARGVQGSAKAEVSLQREDDASVPVQLSCRVLDSGGARTLSVVVTDLTERTRVETERRRAQEALRQANAYNRSLIEASLDPFVTIGPDGKITDVNTATEAATGCARAELIGTDFSDCFTEPEKARAGYQQVFRDGLVRDYPLELRHRTGRVVSVLYNAAVYRDEQGKVIGVFAAARDVTERKRADETIRRLNSDLERRVRERTAELEAANKELETFAYSVSHDLRAPLRAMDGFSRIALRDAAGLSAEGREALQIVRDSAQQMGRLIDDLLGFSRMSRQTVRKQPVACDALVRECLEILRPETEGRRVEITIGTLPDCSADRGLMRLVWTNLLSNALKFTRPRNPARIEIGSRSEDGTVYFVRDNGVGFKMAYAEKLFGVFQRLHRAEDFEGTGVGLATVQRIVHRHGGRIWAEEELEHGATFFFTLEPRQKP